MTRQITPDTSLDNLKKEAKRWLKELRLNNPEALARLQKANPRAHATPVLREIQHALALEFGMPGWKDLKLALENRATGSSLPEETLEQITRRFLEYACPDHHVRGRPTHRIASHAAMRLLQQYPEIAKANLYTAVVCGELEEVERRLRAEPELVGKKSSLPAAERDGPGSSEDLFKDLEPKNWEPLLYACFTRLPLAKANENSVAIARLLLDLGADPNAYFEAGGCHYTPLTGVIGEGEEDRPAHPQREDLAQLLLERGANPYDMQVNYNMHFHGKVLWFLKRIYDSSVKAGKRADWDDPNWQMLNAGNYGCGARWFLSTAIKKNDLELAEWCLEHGASANPPPPVATSLFQGTLHEHAVRFGRDKIAELLLRYGAAATPDTPASSPEDEFVSACFQRDRTRAQALLEQHPDLLRSPAALHAAAEHDNEDVAEFVLDLGVSADVEGNGRQRPLHVAAYNGATGVAELLIRRRAKIDPLDAHHDSTPLWFAMWADRTAMVTLLSRYSRDVWALSFTGNVERVKEVLQAEPEIATYPGMSTPLFWLPEEEAKALELTELFLSAGVDPRFRRKDDGTTASQVARRRGLNAVADRLIEAEAAGLPKDKTRTTSPEVLKYEKLARDVVKAYAGDVEAMQRINDHWGRTMSVDDLRAIVWRLVYKVRQAGGSAEAFGVAEAQEIIAHGSGFQNWSAFMESVEHGTPPPGDAYSIDSKQNKISPRRIPRPQDWDTIIGIMKERRIPALQANGFMTDEAMRKISELDFVTALNLSGSRELGDDGLLHLARMPQLQNLVLNEYPGGKLTDRGLQVLRSLPELRHFEMTWQRGITDAGVSNLKDCHKLESVNLMGSPTGDGAIEALRGKPHLGRFSTGRMVTDHGLSLLPDFPFFRSGSGENPAVFVEDSERTPRLLLDGPFTNAGLANVAGLAGVFDLDLFWHVTGITSEGFAHLTAMANLQSLGCDGKLSDDGAMGHIAAMPRLRKLRIQESIATDDGFVALSKSRSIEGIWGRVCPNFRSRGFLALSTMPALRSFGIGCQNVDDDALSSLPSFPALRELTPIGMKDDAFRYVGRCNRLERLTCMYCRDTTDVATEHIAQLQLKYYYAGLTLITDRSLEILGQMTSLETVEFYETKSVTDAGLAYLVDLPNLKKISIGGLPNVTLQGTKVFPAHVEVNYDL